MPVVVSGILGALAFFFARKRRRQKKHAHLISTPEKWRHILAHRVNFYKNLNEDQQRQFESDVQNFLSEVRITGVKVDVTLQDRLLVASSAVIPLFGFPTWTYDGLTEVLLYPDSFDRNFKIRSKREIITGMVGSGAMRGKVILSKPALHHGFDNATDKRNVGIHEFVHLFDGEDGWIDGIPPGIDDEQSPLWLDFVHKKIGEIVAEESDIDGYGAYNRQEFFAVASEYFFERPDLLQKKHPQLYEMLSEVFRQDRSMDIDPSTFENAPEPSRNEPCPCGSGKKYKRCCLV